MVKTRKSVKRTSKSSKEEPPDNENKKPKIELQDKSKYFTSKNESSSVLNENLGIEENKNQPDDSDDSSGSLFRRKSKKVVNIEEESESDGSSSDEFMKAPISLDDLGNFETLKKGINTPTDKNKLVLSSTVSRLSDDSDDAVETNEQEFYDFSQIMKSQELIMNTKKEQEEKCKQEVHVLPLNKSKRKSAKPTKKAKEDNKPDLKSLGEELGISELLAIAEGPHVSTHDGSEDTESEDKEEIKTEDKYPTVPKDGVQVTIELPNVNQVRKKKGFDVEAALKRRINLIKKENQVFMHKVHTLCWIAHGIYLNRSINSDELMGLALSLIPSNHCYPKKHMDLRYLEKLVEWFVGKVVVVKEQTLSSSNLSLIEVLKTQISLKKVPSEKDLVLIFVCILRSLGINVRLVINLRSVPIRPPITDLCSISNKLKEKESSSDDKNSLTSCNLTSQVNGPIDSASPKIPKTSRGSKKEKSKTNKESEIKSPYFSSSDDLPLTDIIRKKSCSTTSKGSAFPSEVLNGKSNLKSRKTHSGVIKTSSPTSSNKRNNNSGEDKIKQKRGRKSACAAIQDHSSSSEDEVFQKRSERQKKPIANSKALNNGVRKKSNKLSCDDEFEPPRASTSKSKDRRVLSTDDEDTAGFNKIGSDYWAEVFVEEEEKWISVDLTKGKVHCINQLYKKATQPVRYILAWNNDGSIKDVTRRYAPQWMTVTRKQRADEEWWQETMAPYVPSRTAREREEDEDLDRQIHDQPLPSTIADYKNHPLFALKRHLLKFQAIYPPEAPPLGFIKDEPVYSRGCVVELHTRETWIKEAKLVRRGEEPYKIVKARPKYDKLSGARLNDLPLPLFGYWQVEDYIPPPAVDGKVPRNEYGNVELYKPCMLPPGTVHLQVPGLARVARKLDIDCAPAVVGWEFSGGGSHPVLDGFIVCEEFRDILLDAWNKEIDESAKRAREKVEQRVYGNWKRLIKGLLIRERLKARYDFGDTEKKKKKQQPKPGSSKS